MPKNVTDQEREMVRNAIYEKTKRLIKEKKLRTVTVDDIVQAVGISKGSFYHYYPSKEACLFEVIKRYERESFTKIEKILSIDKPDKDKIVHVLQELFVSKDSLFTSINSLDVEILLRKLPPEYSEQEVQKVENNFQKMLGLLNLNEQDMEIVALLTDCLSYMSSKQGYSQNSVDNSLNILINTIANYIVKERG